MDWLKFLEKNLLPPSKWQSLFKQEEITCEEELELCQGEVPVYTALSAQASAMEKRKLKKLLKIDRTPKEEMNKIIIESGLDPDIWVENFKHIRVITPEALVLCGEESYESLCQFAENPFENRALRRLLKMDEVKIDPDTCIESSVYRDLAHQSHLASPLLPVETQESQTQEETMGNKSKNSHESIDPFESSCSKTNLAKSPWPENDELLQKAIQDSGLDPVIWVESFKREGVTSPTDMKVRGKELYDSLSKHVKSSFEKEVLRNVLGLEDIPEPYNTQSSPESPIMSIINSPPLPIEVPKEQMETNQAVSLQNAETRNSTENEKMVKLLQESGLEHNCDTQTSTESTPPLLNSTPLPVENNEIPKEQMKTNEAVSLQDAETPNSTENEKMVKTLQEHNCNTQTSTESIPPLLNSAPLPVENNEIPKEQMKTVSLQDAETPNSTENEKMVKTLQTSTESTPPLLNSTPLPVENNEIPKEQMKTNEAVSLQDAETPNSTENEKMVKTLQERNCNTQTSTESTPPLLNSTLLPVENNEIPKEQMKTVSLQDAETPNSTENEKMVKTLQTSTESTPPLLNSTPLPVENNEIPKEQMKTNEAVSLQDAETPNSTENEKMVKTLQERNCDTQTSTESTPPILNFPPTLPVKIPKEQMKTNEAVSLQGAETQISENEKMVKMLQESDLDPEGWIDHFKTIGVTTPVALKMCGQESYDSLSKFVKSPFEEESLLDFLGMKETIPSVGEKYSVQPISYSDFLEKLGFFKYYPQKLTLQESLVVNGDKYSCNSTTDPQKLLLSTLEKIKKSNCNFRKIMLYEKKDLSDDDVPEILVHPMDSLLALIYCSDNFLRQYLYLKLSASQLAVPLLLPDLESNTLTLPLWSLRSIVKKWSSSATSHEDRMVDYQAPLISFVRFNNPDNYSKSKILNNVMSESKHDSFFNHECEGSSVNRHFLNGLVEACWYLPSNMETDPFSDVILFANLRGNASHYKQQFEFISSHSCMLVVFLVEDDICTIEKRLNKSGKCQFLFLMHRCSQPAREKLKALAPSCLVFELFGREPAAVVKYIRSKVLKTLSTEANGSFFQLSSIVTSSGIVIDEKYIVPCKEGKTLAQRIMDKVKDINPNQFKEEQLPLQGPDLWHKWAGFNKKQNRMKQEEMGNNGPEKFSKKMKKEKETIRRKQLKKNRSFAMGIFIEVLLKQPKQVTLYFLEWLKIFLDDRSRKILPELQDKCKTARKKLQKANNDNDKIRKELKDCDQKLVHASFGIEHLFRELGQIYESAMEMQKEVQPQQIQEMKQLAEVTSDLFLSGYPLEIVDGDASHIPLQWITAILENVKQKLNNAKMAVLSVLGVQSSGKSTLMNTMFGIRFAVSAGRCTRGAFFQIMKLNPSFSPNCQYLIVIDTEGLRAPELDYQQRQQHDNELATLVIGLANVTFVNIQGEAAAEINDVLQTSVHAFLRMKQVELTPSCQFVRHNVDNVSASKTFEGNQRLQDQLDKMTQLAAKTEHIDGHYKCFNDVITFNNETDIYNFPNLWDGNPPMAPVNPAYCEATRNLQHKLIKLFRNKGLFCSINDFITKVQQLWTAVLKENFVFSFKNILEIEAFAALDREYGKWSWRFENIKLKWEQSVRKSIMPNTKNVESLKSKLINNVMQQLDKEYDRIMKDFDNFFENSSSAIASIMEQWNARYKQKLACLRADHVNNASRFCQNIIEENQAKVKLEDMKKNARDQFDEHLRRLVLDTVVEKEGDLTKEELQDIKVKFDEHWREWMDKLNSEYPLNEQIDLDFRISTCLRDKCQLIQLDFILIDELKDQPLTMRMPQSTILKLDTAKYLQPREAWGLVGNVQSLEGNNQSRGILGNLGQPAVRLINHFLDFFPLYHSDLVIADTVTKEIYEEVKQYFLENDVYYDDGHILNIVKALSDRIDNSEKLFSQYSFTKQYKINMILDISSYALNFFTRKQQEAVNNHPVTYLQSLCRQYKLQFEALCSRTAQEKKAALVLVDIVMMQLMKALEDKLILRLADDARMNNPIFTCKRDLTGRVLLSLLEKRDFDAYKTYLTDIRSSYFHWIQVFFEEHCQQCTSSGKTKNFQFAQVELKSIVNDIIDAANHAYASCSETSESWLKCFQTKLNNVISFNEEQGHFLIKLEGKDRVKSFTEEFVREIQEEEKKRIEGAEFFNGTTIIAKAAEIICDNVAGCCEQCPFCKEQCEITDKDHKGHDHFCELHRPQCLGTYRWEKSQKMVLDICTDLVQSRSTFRCAASNHKIVPYKEYRTIYPDWCISDGTRQIAPYWKWFTANYTDEIVAFFEFKEEEIDPDWKCLDESDAEEDVKKRYRLK